MLLDLLDEVLFRHYPHRCIHVLAVLEDENTRNRAYGEAHRSVLIRVDVELRNLDSSVILLGDLLDDRCDHVTRAAPRSPEVYYRYALVLLNFTGKIFIRHYSWICRLHLTLPLIVLGGRTGPRNPVTETGNFLLLSASGTTNREVLKR